MRFSERYEIKNQAGVGGMGIVYQALDRQKGLLVALKILHSRNTIELARFDQEARVLAELSHPGIVRYFDHGTTPNGSPYIAMEWLEGETLEERIARGTLSPVATAHVAHLVLDALAAAHSKYIVHRDIKPGNIFLVGRKLTEIRVLDFGIARRLVDDKRLTRKGSTVGTPLYTSPEQARGRADVDGRADIFSLGCVLFEALTGDPPFTGDAPIEVMTKVCAGRVPEIASRRPDILPALSNLVQSMLNPDRGIRPASAEVLAHRFAAVVRRLGGISAEVSGDTPPPLVKRDCISDIEEHLACAMLMSPATGKPGRTTAGGSRPSSVAPASPPRPESAARSQEDPRLGEIRGVLALFACEMDCLQGGGLLMTAPTVSTAQEQAIQLASAALALRAQEPEARLAIATGRATFLGRLPVGQLMDRLPTLMDEQVAGTIRIDETTQRLLPSRFVVGGAVDKPILLDEDDVTHFERPRRAGGRENFFFGRERDVALLHSVLKEIVHEKTAASVLILGRSGLGKSRLLREFVASIHGAAPPVVLGCGSLLRNERLYPALAPVLRSAGIDIQDKSSVQIETAFAAWLAGRCAGQGLLLVIEDLQWADSPSLDMVDRILHILRDKPVMAVGVGREDVDDKFPGLWGWCAVQRMRLRPLPNKYGTRLLRHWLPTISRKVEESLLDRWEGNPRFLEELAAAAPSEQLRIPDSIYATVEGRLEGLEPDVRRVLRAASLFGEKAFTTDALIALLGDAARKCIAEWMEILIMRDFIVRDVNLGEATYAVHERLVADATYRMLTGPDRVLARRLARAWLNSAGRTLPEYLNSMFSQSERRSATGG